MFKNIQERWGDSGTGARIGFAAGIVAIVLLCAAMIYWVSRDTYQVLFSDLDPQDATTMIKELDKMKVAYRLEEGGRTILVDQDAVYKTRLKLMGEGVQLRGTVGFEIFNNTDFGTTEFAQKINFQRALQGELARTIMDFEEIKFARVHLVMPESGLFKKSNVKPKASISLIMKGDSQLSPEQVAGIQRLVAASVPEIDANSVTVLDQRGVALTRKIDAENDIELSNGRLETKKQVENYLTQKIAAMLDKVVGPGQAIVSVDATLTQDHVKITREDVIPLANQNGENTGSLVRRRQSQQGQIQSGSNSVASLQLGNEGQENSEPVKRETARKTVNGMEEVEYQNGRKVEQSVSTPGGIRRISVGVLLPDTVSAEQLDKIREVVSMAAGISASRGDSIAIYSIEQFAGKTQQAVSAALPASTGHVQPAAKEEVESGRIVNILAALFGACLLIVGLAFWLRKTRHKQNAISARTVMMSEAERMEMLSHVRQWLHSDTPANQLQVRS